MTINYKKLGLRIKEMRLSKGFSQEQLAEKCNLSTSYISYIETGKRKVNLSQLENIAKQLNFTIDIFSKNDKTPSLSKLIRKCTKKEKSFIYKVVNLIISELENFQLDS